MFIFFFFKQKTAYEMRISDWSSDVCSSDLFPGDTAYEEYVTSDIQVKQSSFSGGRSVIDSYRSLYVDAAGAPLATREHSLVNAERKGSKEKGKYADVARHTYTPDDIARIDEVYDAEQRRGATIRYFEAGEATGRANV